jgi:hypothetical protein
MKKQLVFLAALLAISTLASSLVNRVIESRPQPAGIPTIIIEFPPTATTQPQATATELQPTYTPVQPSPTVAASATAEPAAQPSPTVPAPVQTMILVDADAQTPQFILVDPLTGQVKSKFTAKGAPKYGYGYASETAVYYQAADLVSGFWRVGLDGGVSQLKFMNPDDYLGSTGFLPSPDGKRIAWGQFITMDSGGKTHSTLKVANADGSDEKTLLDATDEGPFYRTPVGWSRDGQSLYYSGVPDGIGGYMLFGNGTDLVRVDLKTGQEQVIMSDRSTFRPFARSPVRRMRKPWSI